MRRKIVYFVLLGLLATIGVEGYKYIPEESELKKFRTSLSVYESSGTIHPDRQGLDQLHVSGSGALMEETLLRALPQIPAQPSQIYIVDLTTSPETFIDGHPASWTNRQVTTHGIDEPYNSDYNPSHLRDNLLWYLRRKLYPCQQGARVESEEEMVKRLGFNFVRFSVSRKKAFPPEVIDEFIDFVQDLPEGAWVHFHCFGGCSRTTSFMIMYDIIKNGTQVPLNTIIERHWALGGTNMNDTSVHWWSSTWRKEALIKRKELLEDFYLYRNDPDGFGKMKWSLWLEKQKKVYDWDADKGDGA